jgi:hypothetical protein
MRHDFFSSNRRVPDAVDIAKEYGDGHKGEPEEVAEEVIPVVAKAGGLQSPGVKGEIVVSYLDPLTTQDLKFSGFPIG